MSDNKKVLIVDDVDFFIDLMTGYLQRSPVDVLQARNGREAIDMAKLHWPDVICMDVAMPETDGVEACRLIKEDAQLSKCPVILLYNPDNSDEAEAVNHADCDDSLSKPLAREDFLDMVHRHLFHLERRERRVPCQVTVNCSIAGVEVQGLCVDLSRSGLYVEYRGELPESNNVDASFLLPSVSPEEVVVKGRVAWVNQGHPRPNLSLPQGFGIEFDIVDPKSKQIVDRFISEN